MLLARASCDRVIIFLAHILFIKHFKFLKYFCSRHLFCQFTFIKNSSHWSPYKLRMECVKCNSAFMNWISILQTLWKLNHKGLFEGKRNPLFFKVLCSPEHKNGSKRMRTRVDQIYPHLDAPYNGRAPTGVFAEADPMFMISPFFRLSIWGRTILSMRAGTPMLIFTRLVISPYVLSA